MIRMRRRYLHVCYLLWVWVASSLFLPTSAFSQNWTGSVQCTVTEQDQTYNRQETQSWTLSGTPTGAGNMQVYPATWTDQGTGQLVRSQGTTQSTNISWQTIAQGQATIAFIVRASDGRLMIMTRHARQTVNGGLNANRQITVNGVAQPATPLNHAVFEWMFPHIEASPTDTNISGSAQSQTEGLSAELVHRYGVPPPNASCQWNFTKGGTQSQSPNPNNNPTGSGGTSNQGSPNSPNNPGPTTTGATNNQNCQSAASVQQTFETMKSQLQAQYDTLIQGTSDPVEIASLKNQEQRTIASLNNQEQHDMTLASQGCLPATSGNNGGAATGGSAGAAGSAGGSSAAGGGANAGGGSYAGGAAGSGAAGAAGHAGSSSAAGGGASSGGGSNTAGAANSGAANGGAASGGAAGAAGHAGSSSAAGGGASSGGGSNTAGAANGGAASGGAAGAASSGGGASAAGGGANTGATSGGGTANSGSAGGPANSQGAGSAAGGGAGPTQVSAQLLSISPSSVSQGNTVTVRLTGQGTHWQSQNTNLSFGPQITVQTFTADPGGASGTANITVAADASTGTRPVMLMTGAELVGLPAGLTVTASSTQQGASSGNSGSGGGLQVGTPNRQMPSLALLTGLSPATNSGQQNVTVTLTGQLTNFVNGSTTVTFTRTSQPGPSVNVNAAVMKNLTPSGPPPVQVGSVKVNSKTSATVTLSMNPSTAAGTYSITATTPTSSGTPEVVALNNGFTVTPAITLTATTLTPTPATLNVAPAFGSYLVTVTSLRCGRPTLDDPLQLDGKGDEIYASAFVRHYDRRNSQLLDLVYPTTQIYGDSNQSTRVQSGTMSSLGGIHAKDIIPDYPSDAPVDRANIPPKIDLFPLKLWQGTMTDGVDVLVVSPSIWESDGNLTLFNRWVQKQINLNETLISATPVQDQIKNKKFGYFKLGNVSEGTSNINTNGWETAGILALDAIFAIPSVDLPVNTAMDRPIGLAPNDMNSSALPNTTVVLTREIIEAALNGPSTTVYPYFVPNVMVTPQMITVPKPGIMVIVFTDTAAVTGNVPILIGDGPASYAMILQVERVQ